MPYYQYVCKTCGEQFEKKLSFAEADQEQICPSCQSEEVLKLVSIFTMSGFSPDSAQSLSDCGGSGRFT